MAAPVMSLVCNCSRLCTVLLFIFVLEISGLYEDQVGKFDWKQEYIGHVKDVYFPPGSRRIVATTAHNVLVSLHPRNGQIAWRYVHEQHDLGQLDALSGNDESVVVVSGNGKLFRTWDASTGILKQESNLPVLTDEPFRKVHYQFVPDTDELLVVGVTHDYQLFVGSVNLTSNSELWSYLIPVAGKSLSCDFIGDRWFACLDQPKKMLYSFVPKPGQEVKTTPLKTLLGSEISDDVSLVPIMGLFKTQRKSFGLKWAATTVLVTQTKESLKVTQTLKEVESLDATQTSTGLLLFTIVAKGDTTALITRDLETGEENPNFSVDLDLHWYHGEVSKMWVYSVQKKEGGFVYRALLLFKDHALVLVQVPGKPIWQREEALASIINVEMVDLPVSESDAKFEQEFRSGDTNLASMFVKRLTTQLFQLESFLLNVIGGLNPNDMSTTSEKNSKLLTRDEFNLHKMIVVVTAPGKVFGMDSVTGRIIWTRLVNDLQPFDRYGKAQLLLFVQRTTAHFPHHPVCAVVGRHRKTKKGLIHIFNPITGDAVGEGDKQLDFDVVQASLLPQADDNFIRGIIFLDTDDKVHFYPSSTSAVGKAMADDFFLFTVDVDQGKMDGYTLANTFTNEMKASHTWNINIPKSSQSITHVVSKRQNEHVHSQGRVMGDRSVLYKYLNPNLVAVLTEGYDNQQKPFFNVLLIDVVTGNIVFTATHKRCRKPLHIVHSENWIVYSYHNEKARRTEIAVLELYEGKSQSNTTAFSSLNPPSTPMVERQSYIFPPGLNSMAVTITEKGITSKHLLFALPSGGIVELPKSLLDPRRPLIPTMEHKEEGIYPYIPELPVPAENVINYNKSLEQIRDIFTSPAGLESTCLVLAYGIDLFFTRVTPSRTFDVLKDDFDHYLITAVLLALILASYGTKRLAARKALHQAWK